MVNVGRSGDQGNVTLGLAEALAWLAEFSLEAGTAVCLGIRLEGFSATAWQEARAWLDGGARVSGSESLRASRFLHVADAVRHLLARSLLRQVLTRQGVCALPDVWPVNAWGKPEGTAWGMYFNLSHAGSDVWLACSREAAVGIDVEDGCPALDDLLPLLHPAEIDDLLMSDADALRRQRLWVRKEAVIKATGQGLSLPLTSFRVALDERAAWLLQAPQDYPAPWTTRDLPAAGSAAVALAVRGLPVAVRWRLACVRGASVMGQAGHPCLPAPSRPDEPSSGFPFQ